jgi:nitrous oxidase accessory protein NosD
VRTLAHRFMGACASAMALSISGAPAEARTATPATLADAFAALRNGETLTLMPGNYGSVTMPTRRFTRTLIVDATRATFSQLTIRNTSGVEMRGGRVTGPSSQAYGVAIDSARQVRVTGMIITGPRVGITISRSTGVRVDLNVFDGVRSDGVNVTMASQVIIQNNVCRNFRPIMPVYASDGRLLVDGDHPDCVQGWSTPGAQRTDDIIVTGNVGTGYMQGIFFRNPLGGRFRRLTVRNNTMVVSAWNGIVLQDVDGATVTDNLVRSVPGSRMLNFPFGLIRAWIRIQGRTLVVCDNEAPDDPERQGTRRC